MSPRLQALYVVRSDGHAIEARARALAVEQSVEMPVSAIDDEFVRAEIVGQVDAIRERSESLFEVRITLSSESVGDDAGQLLNMLFGNSSLQDDVVLGDVSLPAEVMRNFGGPHHGLAELRRRVGAADRALTCSALKPQGLAPARLVQLALQFAEGGVDYIKDDHGLADQTYSPFALRVPPIAEALRRLGHAARYAPNLSGDLDDMRRQIGIARDAGVDTVLAAPMLMGFANFHRLVADNADLAFIAHPSMAGAARIAPPLLMGKLFRLMGVDAVVFPHHGGRFGYSLDTCRALANAAVDRQNGLLPCVPVPAGGMTPARVPEVLDFYGPEVMLLIGGALLESREQLTAATADFVGQVHRHSFGRA
ncbi:MAG: RuBisCO large subunit C-terminal-like domain-containing protein [Xanthobacteraceae bacterium]